MRYISILLVFILMIPSSSALAENKFKDREKLSNKIEKMFFKREFRILNEIEFGLRENKKRFPSGIWQLTYFYNKVGKLPVDAKEKEWEKNFFLVDQWIKSAPNRPAGYLVKAEMLISYAWAARGNGFASTVSKRQWKNYNKRLAQAQRVLKHSKKITDKNPYYYVIKTKLAIAQDLPEDDFNILYQKATQIAPTYYYLHFQSAAYYQTKWGGSASAINEFVNTAVEKSKSREGMTLYARLYWSQSESLGDDLFKEGNAEWTKMNKGFKRIMREYPKSDWNLNAYTRFACIAEDWKTTKKLMQKIGNNPILDIWDNQDQYNRCKRISNLKKF